ncbi:DivIVA domain-containing protein [Paratissierella segnis]|jgi:cell division initiation protein|uniref:DivIVA domain-containing protein n=1 Tax=Paratissierella segnis TaxID=2763679 RepID=A0A926EY56_9FIRM|nr:DivIVA domain-containing protein [Paratissierella segnis]MBC8588652.1 DivIVA domain-containing protein [Paratissierella segnis]
MITPLDIQNKEFNKSFRGYNSKNVDIFLDEIIDDYEKIYKENIELKDKINMLSDQISHYKSMEETLKSTLIVAQTTSEDVVLAARQKSDSIIEDAEITAKKMIEQAREDVRNIKQEYEYLKKEIFVFKTRYKSFIEAQLISLDDFYTEVEDVRKEGSKNEENSESKEITNLGA